MVRLPSFFFLAVLAYSTASISQTSLSVAPVPTDPLELATGPTKVLDTPQDRSAILELVERARQNFDMHAAGTPPFELKVSFDASGRVAYTGPGEMEETWFSAQRGRWSAHLGAYSQTRIFAGGRAFDSKTPGGIPMRVQMVRGSIFWPIVGPAPHALMKATPANWKGVDVVCALFSGGLNAAVPTTGRQWQETEYCFDPKSSLLMTYSEAPGIYVSYDYSNALSFHGRVIPRTVSVVENSSTVLSIHVDSLKDAGAVDQTLFTPTAEMIAQGPGAMLSLPYRFPRFTPAPSGYKGPVQPMIVHATVGQDGRVLEAEALQTSDTLLSDSALDLVRNASWPFAADRVPWQREMFVNVQFVPQRQ
jgi:hypothetical protein